MTETRKLKRGLKDISPLFHEERGEKAHVALQTVEPVLEIASVFSPDAPGDSVFFNHYLAAEVAGAGYPCSMLSIRSHLPAKVALEQGRALERFKARSLTWEQFKEICLRPLGEPSPAEVPHRMIFLDFEYQRGKCLERVAPLLDKWIVVLQFSMESLSEAYKMMKGMVLLNPHLQPFVLFEGETPNACAEALFERFSEMTSRRLGLNLIWLGCIQPGRTGERQLSDAAFDQLLARPAGSFDSPEKISLARFVG